MPTDRNRPAAPAPTKLRNTANRHPVSHGQRGRTRRRPQREQRHRPRTVRVATRWASPGRMGRQRPNTSGNRPDDRCLGRGYVRKSRRCHWQRRGVERQHKRAKVRLLRSVISDSVVDRHTRVPATNVICSTFGEAELRNVSVSSTTYEARARDAYDVAAFHGY
jgi:hypothetical protein